MRPENCVGCCQVLISTLWACTAYQFGVAYVHPMVLSKPESRNTQKLSEHVRDKGSGGRPTSRPNGRFPRTQRSSSKKRTFKAARDVHSTIQLWKTSVLSGTQAVHQQYSVSNSHAQEAKKSRGHRSLGRNTS